MKTPFPNAFTINSVGLFPPKPFPLSVGVSAQPDGVTLLELFPQRVKDIADLIPSRSQRTLLVFDVDHASMERLEQVARTNQLHHVRYEPNAIAIRSQDLEVLLARLQHWEFHVLDCPEPPPSELIDRSLLNHPGNEVLELDLPHPDFPLAGLGIHAHDDCFLRIHAKQDDLLRAVFSRTLEMYAGTLLGKEAKPDIAEMPRELINELWTVPLTLTFWREEASAGPTGVVMGFSRTECSLREPRDYPLAGRLTYEPLTGVWSLA